MIVEQPPTPNPAENIYIAPVVSERPGVVRGHCLAPHVVNLAPYVFNLNCWILEKDWQATFPKHIIISGFTDSNCSHKYLIQMDLALGLS